MGADAGIYSLIQQPKLASPMEAYGGALQLKGLIDQQALHDLQRKQLVEADQENQRIKDLFYAGQAPSDSAVMSASPKFGTTYIKSKLEADKIKSDTRAKEMEALAKSAALLKDRLPTVRDESSYAAYVDQAKALLGPDKVAQLGLPPSFDPEWVKRQVVKAEELFTPQPMEMDLGGKKVIIDKNPWTNPRIVGSEFEKTITPGEKLSSDTTRRGQDISAQTTRRGQDLVENRERDVDLQGRLTAAREGAKNTVEAQAALPGVVQNAERAVRLIDELVGSPDGKVKAHPGFNNAVGMPNLLNGGPLAGFIPGTHTTDFKRRFEEIKGGAFMEAFNSLRGGGQITEKEGEKATAAMTRMSTSQSEGEFVRAAREFQDVVRKGVERAKAKASGPYAPGKPAAGGRDKVGGVLTQNPDGSFNYGF